MLWRDKGEDEGKRRSQVSKSPYTFTHAFKSTRMATESVMKPGRAIQADGDNISVLANHRRMFFIQEHGIRGHGRNHAEAADVPKKVSQVGV